MIPSPNMIMRDWLDKDLSQRQLWYKRRQRKLWKAILIGLALTIWVLCR